MWGLALKGALGAVSGLLSALAKWAGYLFAYRLGRSKEAAKVTEKTRDVLQDQLEIASRPDAHRSDLLDGMRKRKRGD